jgi:TorA maturation chaperone TorD
MAVTPEDKKLNKLKKLLGEDTMAEIEAMSPQELKNRIVVAEQSVQTALDELEANEEYQELKENMKAVRAGLNDVKKRQNAIIDYCLDNLQEDVVIPE